MMHGKYPIQIPIKYHEKKTQGILKNGTLTNTHWVFWKKILQNILKNEMFASANIFFVEMLHMILCYLSVLSNILIFFFWDVFTI
jgi:hypothetical protein